MTSFVVTKFDGKIHRRKVVSACSIEDIETRVLAKLPVGTTATVHQVPKVINLDSADTLKIYGSVNNFVNLDVTLEFDNGCSINLMDLEGQSPYGTPWLVNAGPNLAFSIISWVGFWSVSRDETGALCDLTEQNVWSEDQDDVNHLFH